MKVAVLMLSYNRFDILKKTLTHNMKNAGHPFDLYIWDNGSTDPKVRKYLEKLKGVKSVIFEKSNTGIAHPFNVMLNELKEKYDAFQFMANDILEPDNWLLTKVNYLKAIPDSGMISIALGDHLYPYAEINGMPLYPGHVIGQFLISRAVVESLGAFREDFGKYGPIDNDYNVRCDRKRFLNYYLPDLQAVHLDDNDNMKYGYDKAAQVEKTWPEFVASLPRYNDTYNCYIPFDGQLTHNMKDHV